MQQAAEQMRQEASNTGKFNFLRNKKKNCNNTIDFDVGTHMQRIAEEDSPEQQFANSVNPNSYMAKGQVS